MDDEAPTTGKQPDLALPVPASLDELPLLPARMINEYQYCPRLAYLEWVQSEWEDSAETVDGRRVHRRVDRKGGRLPEAEELTDEDRVHARSVTLSSPRLGLIARMDLIEAQGTEVTPIDYKRGRRPHVASGAYDPERVQLCVQGLILEEHGYRCDQGILYFAGSKERVTVRFDEELRALTRQAIDGLRLIAAGGRVPQPLVDSPKCSGCSLVSICLPDEVNFLQQGAVEPRPLVVGREPALPVYVQSHRGKVAKKGERLEITVDDEKVAHAALPDVSQLVVQGNVYVTTPTLHELMRRGIPISWHSFGGWFLGHSVGTGHRNVELRIAQYDAARTRRISLAIARSLVEAKILNARTLLRRNWKGDQRPEETLGRLKGDAQRATRAGSLESLLGVEGTAAARYFGEFPGILKEEAIADGFDFANRNRRPPQDPVNAMLSFAYALLVRSWTIALSATGLDPYLGFYHQPRYGRPALALDMMEPFRPIIADSAVIQAVNNGEVGGEDFVRAAGSVNLDAGGRKKLIMAFERRMDQEVTHPLFGYRLSYRRLMELESRLLGRFLLGEIPSYPAFRTR